MAQHVDHHQYLYIYTYIRTWILDNVYHETLWNDRGDFKKNMTFDTHVCHILLQTLFKSSGRYTNGYTHTAYYRSPAMAPYGHKPRLVPPPPKATVSHRRLCDGAGRVIVPRHVVFSLCMFQFSMFLTEAFDKYIFYIHL